MKKFLQTALEIIAVLLVGSFGFIEGAKGALMICKSLMSRIAP